MGQICWEIGTDIYTLGFPSGSVGKESACNVGDLGSIPGLERSPGEGNSNPLQYFGLKNSMDREARQATVHGMAKNWTQLCNFLFLYTTMYKIDN